MTFGTSSAGCWSRRRDRATRCPSWPEHTYPDVPSSVPSSARQLENGRFGDDQHSICAEVRQLAAAGLAGDLQRSVQTELSGSSTSFSEGPSVRSGLDDHALQIPRVVGETLDTVGADDHGVGVAEPARPET